ncbi:hypothetical protein, partial [Geodermatophilus sp. CPCC 205506]|uniref:hypothetical protein n=1 Tax=Geodermatophilus sp. CPCC 205506 TaxID=2936596 RepID=UPI003EEAA608
RGAGTAAAVAAVGLIALSGPATEVAADVAAARTTVRTATPAPAAVAAAPTVSTPVVPVPVPQDPVATVDIPRPGPIDLEVRPPFVPVGVAPELEPRPETCGGYGNPRRIVPGVVPGPGSATVSWQADARSDVLGYRVTAVVQRLVTGAQPEPPVQVAAQPEGCVPVGVTFAGLTPGVPYVFWLEEEIQDSWSVRRVHVGTSSPVAIG